MEKAYPVYLRSVIVATLAGCLTLAIAPWMSGGQDSIARLISAMALVLAALLAWMQPEVRKLRFGPLAISFVALVGLGLLSLLWSVNRYSTGLWVVEWVMAGLAFRTAHVLAGEPSGRELMIRAYLASAAVFSFVAVGMYLFSDYERLTGTFYWANPAAAYLIPAILIVIDRLRRSEGKQAYWWAGGLVLGLATFALTDSRAASLVLLLVSGFYLLVADTRKHFWITFVFSFAVAIAASFALSVLSTHLAHRGNAVVPGSRFAEAARGESTSGSDRLYYLRSAANIWWAHPLGGTGAGTYGDVHPQYQERVISASRDVHNIYVQTLAELGLAGGVALAAILLWLTLGVLKGLIKNPENMPLVIGSLGLLMHFGLDIDASYPALLMLLAVLLGLVYRQWSEARGRSSWLWALYAALIVVPVVSLYLSDTWAKRAKISQEDGDYDLAAQQYERAQNGVLYNPDIVGAEGIAHYVLGVTPGSNAKAELNNALERAYEAQKLDPHDGQHHQLEGRVYVALGKAEAAELAFRQALSLDHFNHPDYALDLAATQVAGGDEAGAIKTAGEMLGQYPRVVADNRSTDPTVRPALANLEALIGNIHLRNGQIDPAREAAKRALQYDPKSLRGRALMNQLLK